MVIDLDAQLQEFRATHRAVRAEVAGTIWRYFVVGQGLDTLLLLPGAPGIAEMAFPYLNTLTRQYRVIAPSYPADIGSLEQLLTGLGALLTHEADGPVHLIGASYSGMVAQYLLDRHPEQVASLLIGDTGMPRGDRARAMGLAVAALRRLPRLGLQLMLNGALVYVLKGKTPAHRFWQHYFRDVVTMLTVPEFANRVQVMIDMDRGGLAPETNWRGPTLLMETADDPLFSAAERAALRARYPQAEIHTFYNQGHITALTRAPEYLVVMEDFLARIAGAPDQSGARSWSRTGSGG